MTGSILLNISNSSKITLNDLFKTQYITIKLKITKQSQPSDNSSSWEVEIDASLKDCPDFKYHEIFTLAQDKILTFGFWVSQNNTDVNLFCPHTCTDLERFKNKTILKIEALKDKLAVFSDVLLFPCVINAPINFQRRFKS